MKKLFCIAFIVFLTSCEEEENNTTTIGNDLNEKIEEEIKHKPEITEGEIQEINTEVLIDSITASKLKKLDSSFTSTPFYLNVESKNYFIVSNAKKSNNTNFQKGAKYGISDDSLNIILPIIYDKIYNPNTTILHCFEIKKNGKIGLYNYLTNEVLDPMFNFIIPSKSEIGLVAYGFNDEGWFKIRSSFFNEKPILIEYFDPSKIEGLTYNSSEVAKFSFKHTYLKQDEPLYGNSTLVLPSYIEKLSLSDRTVYEDFISNQANVDFGTDEVKLDIYAKTNIKDKLVSYFVSFLETGLDARDYTSETEKLIVYNEVSKNTNSITIDKIERPSYFCPSKSLTFKNDSILEYKVNGRKYNYDDQLYDWQTRFNYYKITNEGEIIPLKSNRHFDCTKFVKIDATYFKGCFGKFMTEMDDEEYNVWMSEHLTIEDLDIMRNEIFAEYGYKFKSDKWRYISAIYSPNNTSKIKNGIRLDLKMSMINLLKSINIILKSF